MIKFQPGQLVRYRLTDHADTLGIVIASSRESKKTTQGEYIPAYGNNVAIYQVWWSVAPSVDTDWANSYWWGEESLELIEDG